MYTILNSDCFLVTYWLVALFSSLLITYFTPDIHNISKWKDCSLPSRISQILLNFTGSVLGWLSLGYFIFFRLDAGLHIEILDVVSLLVAFYGINGYLPYILLQKGLPWK